MNEPQTGQQQGGTGAYAQASEQSGGPTGTTTGEAGAAVDQAKDQAVSLVGQVKEKALTAVSDQKDGIADGIDNLAQTVKKSGEQFAGQQDWIAGAIDRGAAELSSLASSLRENDLGSLVGQVRSFARRQPALFVGACLAAGFAVARLGKVVVADVSRDDLPILPEVGHGER